MPTQPTASTPTTIPGVTLQVYVAERAEPRAVLVVFALQVDASGASTVNANGLALFQGLSANYLNGTSNSITPSVSGVAMFDPSGLKLYETYMADPSTDSSCLCSRIDNTYAGNKPGTYYFAALVAARRATVTSISFVTGLGTIPNVALGG